jgi:hypothetical protein
VGNEQHTMLTVIFFFGKQLFDRCSTLLFRFTTLLFRFATLLFRFTSVLLPPLPAPQVSMIVSNEQHTMMIFEFVAPVAQRSSERKRKMP